MTVTVTQPATSRASILAQPLEPDCFLENFRRRIEMGQVADADVSAGGQAGVDTERIFADVLEHYGQPSQQLSCEKAGKEVCGPGRLWRKLAASTFILMFLHRKSFSVFPCRCASQRCWAA